ncbi:ankyrin repeat domain-containing protein [Candidatus Palauibacter sp.]|uniref:ankyrin repeat domain-containing protein n=1 Tax=Candidatus Palauibacter sp. TaxID=3101350 RepID=UPI003B02005C
MKHALKHSRPPVLAAAVLFALGAAAPVGLPAGPDAPVAEAAMRGDLAAVRSLLAEGEDVNGALGDGMTALHWAAMKGRLDLAEVLIDAGADLEAGTRLGGHTPLHVASRAAQAPLVEALLAAGADAGAATTTGAAALHFAAATGSAGAIGALLRHGADPNVREPEWGQTPLMFAAAAGRAGAVRALIDAGADASLSAYVLDIVARDAWDQLDRRERNARVAALRAGRTPPPPSEREAAPQPTAGAGPGLQPVRLEDPEEPTCSGCLGNYADLVGTHGGLTALLLAAREGHRDAALTLLDEGADIDQRSAADGTTALLIAMINGHFDLAMELFARGADPNLASDAGATPLYAALNMHWAPKARHPQPTDVHQQEWAYLDVMRTLLEAGVDPNPRLKKSLWFTTYNRDLLGVDRTGATPFWRAAHALDIEAMKLLLEYGADPALPTTKVERRRYGRGDPVDHSGLEPIPVGGPAVHPIHAAAGVGYGQGFAGNSHRHVPDAWLPAMRFLVEELGADVNARDHNGYTPAHHAASRGDNEMILYLVEQGADVTLVARNGQTTVDLANGPVQRVQPFPETIALLESLGATNNHRCVSC